MSRESLLPFRLRTVRTGVQATFLVLVPLAVVPLLGILPEVDLVPYYVLVSVAAVGAAGIALLPWERLFRAGVGLWLMYAWSVLDIVLIAALVAVTGGMRSEFFWVFVLTSFFFASSYPPRGQVGLFVFTVAAYLGAIAVSGTAFDAGPFVLRLAVLGTLTFMTSFLFSELMSQMAAHEQARSESDRRAALLAAVAHATRSMTTLSTESVLSTVTDAIASLGFEAMNFCFFDDDYETFQVSHGRGLPEPFGPGPHPAHLGIPGFVLEHRRTVHFDDYASEPGANPVFAKAGYRSVIGSPIWVHERLSGVLVAGTRSEMHLGEDDVEAFELLALHAGRALENAIRFEQEQETVRRMEELDQLKSDFLSNVSHELRTPLTVIEGMGLTLEERWDDLPEERRREFLRRMNANAWTLDGVISRLLDFSRLESGRIEAERQLVDLSALALECANRLGDFVDDGQFGTEVTEGLHVEADPGLMDRVLENLLANAVKHTPAHTPVTLTIRRQGDDVVTTVSDEGPGIPPEEVDRISERFYRGRDTVSKQTRGTGLGLALVRQILELHGSELEVDSEMGQGSRFSFRLPHTEASAESSATPEGPELRTAEPTDRSDLPPDGSRTTRSGRT